MDRRFFDLIEKCEECAILANAIARNANSSKDSETYITPRLQDLCTMVSKVQQLLLYEVRSQMIYEPWMQKNDISK